MLEKNDCLKNYTLKLIKLNNEDLQHCFIPYNYKFRPEFVIKLEIVTDFFPGVLVHRDQFYYEWGRYRALGHFSFSNFFKLLLADI